MIESRWLREALRDVAIDRDPYLPYRVRFPQYHPLYERMATAERESGYTPVFNRERRIVQRLVARAKRRYTDEGR